MIIGFSAIITQVIVLRESMIFFSGNELSIGVVLGCWLFYSALGSFIMGRISPGKSDNWFFVFQFLLVLFFFLEIYLLRNSRTLLDIPMGEALPLFDILKYSLILLLPLPFVTGGLFPLAINALEKSTGGNPGYGTGTIYMLEVVGNILGGIVVTLFLMLGYSSLRTGSIVIILVFAALIHLFFRQRKKSTKRGFMPGVVGIIVISVITILFLLRVDQIDLKTRELSFGDLSVVKTIDSRHGNLTITQDRDLYTFFINGTISFFAPAKLQSEEAVHIPMLQNPDARTVLLIGGGISGCLEEILKYNVDRLDYVELDKAVVTSGLEYIDSQVILDSLNGNNERCKIHFGDPFRYIRSTESNIYDVIIMHLPDPSDALSNRFFTLEFFSYAKRILKTGGVISFGLASEPNYIGPELLQVNGSIYHTLKKIFPNILITPGDYNYFIATDDAGEISLDSEFLGNRLLENKIATEYVEAYYLADRLDPDRINFVMSTYESIENPSLNTIQHPHAYFDKLKLSAKRDYIGDENIPTPVIWGGIIGVIMLCGLGAISIRSKKNSFPSIVILYAIAVSGFSLMSSEVVLLYAYQSYVGYIYERIGLIVTVFMAGMALGAFIGTRKLKSDNINSGLITSVLAYLFIYFLVVLSLISKLNEFSTIPVEISILILILISGFIGGYLFPIASFLFGQYQQNQEKSGSLVYGWDLIGAMFGAILPSILFIPYFGLLSAIKIQLYLLFSAIIISALVWIFTKKKRA